MSAITFTAAADETEINPTMRTHFDFSDVCRVRLQAEIKAVSDGVLRVNFSVDDGETWAPLSASGVGPSCTLATLGSASGTSVKVASAARGDVLLGLFVASGVDAEAQIGNVGLLAYVAASYLGECPP